MFSLFVQKSLEEALGDKRIFEAHCGSEEEEEGVGHGESAAGGRKKCSYANDCLLKLFGSEFTEEEVSVTVCAVCLFVCWRNFVFGTP